MPGFGAPSRRPEGCRAFQRRAMALCRAPTAKFSLLTRRESSGYRETLRSGFCTFRRTCHDSELPLPRDERACYHAVPRFKTFQRAVIAEIGMFQSFRLGWWVVLPDGTETLPLNRRKFKRRSGRPCGVYGRTLLHALCTVWVLCVLALTGCTGGAENPAGGLAAGNDGEKKYTIAVIPKGTTHVFWKSVHYGAAQAEKELGNVKIIWKGPLSEADREFQIDLVGQFVALGVDGICLAPLDARSLVDAVAQAKDAGIPTVIFDSALENEDIIVSYVATDNYQGGALAARRIGELLAGDTEAAADFPANAILLRYAVGSESTEQREQGFLETLEKEYPQVTVVSSDQYSGTSPESALDKAQQLLYKYRGEAGGIFGVCEPNADGILGALEQAELTGKVMFVGFDPNEKMVQALQQNHMQGIVLQDPVKMGYLAVKTMAAHLAGEEVEKRISTGEYIATPENMDDPEIHKLLHPNVFD